MFLSGKPLRSSYRVMARDGSVVWFHCDARMVRRPDGSPWFIHGVAFDISDLKDTERALQQERNVVSAILDTVGALVTVLDSEGRIVRFNRACELTTGYALEEVRGKPIWDFFLQAEEIDRARSILSQLSGDLLPQDFQSHWVTRHKDAPPDRLVLLHAAGQRRYAQLHHCNRHRHHRARAIGEGAARHQRS